MPAPSGIQNDRGNLLCLSGDSTGVGVYAANGNLRVTIVDGSVRVGRYAADGSLNVIITTKNSTSDSHLNNNQHASGAIRVSIATNEVGLYAPNGSFYVVGIS